MHGPAERSSTERSALWAWPLVGATVGAALGHATVRINPTVGGGLAAAVFCLEAMAVYALAFAPFGPVAAFVRGRRRAAPRSSAHLLIALGAFAAFAAAQALVSNDKWRSEHHPTSLIAGLGSAVLAVLVLSYVSTLARFADGLLRLRHWPSVAAIVIVVSTLSAALGRPASVAPAPQSKPALSPLPSGGRTLIVIGIDGLDPARIDALIAQDRLPHLRALRERGIYSPLATEQPTWSPILWNTASTGVSGREHGVLDFTEISLPGIERGVQRLRRSALVPRFTGVDPLIHLLVRTGCLREASISGLTRRVPAVWNVLSDLGQQVAVVSWYATWPAETVNGYVVADIDARARIGFAQRESDGVSLAPGITFPAELVDELAQSLPQDLFRLDSACSTDEMLALPIFRELTEVERANLAQVHEAQRSAAHQVGEKSDLLRLAYNVYQRDRFVTEASVHLLKTKKLDFLALYVLGADNISHCLYDRRGVVDGLYDQADETVGRCLAAAGPDTDVILLSDHGWCFEGRDLGHAHAPDGVLILAGPSFVAGAQLARKPTLYDIAPTILALRGLPQPDAMSGAPLLDAFQAELRAAVPTQRIASYGSYSPPSHPDRGSGDMARQDDVGRLKALGYVE